MLITTEQHFCSHPRGSNFATFLCQDNNSNRYDEGLDTPSIKGMQELSRHAQWQNGLKNRLSPIHFSVKDDEGH